MADGSFEIEANFNSSLHPEKHFQFMATDSKDRLGKAEIKRLPSMDTYLIGTAMFSLVSHIIHRPI